MWILVMVLLTPVSGFDRVYRLNQDVYVSMCDCNKVRSQVGFEMAEAYPQEATFRIECHKMPDGVPL